MNLKIIEKIKKDNILSIIVENFDNEVYLVGGTVRDFCLGKESLDRDIIVINREAKDFALVLKKFFNATFVPLDEVNKIYRLVLPDKINYIDITNPIGGKIETDLKRRDLTINAVAVNLKNCEVVDLFDGLNDISNKILRHIDEKNFSDDPLRLLRVFRFQALLGFEISTETYNIMQNYVSLIRKPAIERINYEILKLFSGKYSDIALENMDKLKLLEEILPFVKELKQVPPNSHHHLDLFHHSVETVKQIQKLYDYASLEEKEHLDKVDFGGMSRLAHLKLAGFMHDIGKFSTWTIEQDRHRFIKHDAVGATIAGKMLKEMHFSNKQINYLTKMIKYHIYPSQVMCAPEITDKILMRYIRKMEEDSIDGIFLAKADRLSARGIEITDKIVETNIKSLNYLLQFFHENKKILEPLPKLLSGNEIMEILQIKPSKRLGEIVKVLYEAQVLGEVVTKEDAVNFIKKM